MYQLLLVIIYLAFISLGLPDSLLGSGWPSMYRELNVAVAYAGIISMIIAGGTILSSLFSSKLIGRFGTGLVTAVSVAMTAAALLGFSFSHSFWQLCLWGIPYGLGAGSVDAALNNFVALHYKSRHMRLAALLLGSGRHCRALYHGLVPHERIEMERRVSDRRHHSDRSGGLSGPFSALMEIQREFQSGKCSSAQ